LKMHAAAKATVRVNIFRDRIAVNNLEITLFSLLWSATERPGRTGAKSAWLKIFPLPGLVSRAHCKPESIADALCFPQSESKSGRAAQAVRRLPDPELLQRTFNSATGTGAPGCWPGQK